MRLRRLTDMYQNKLKNQINNPDFDPDEYIK